MNNTVILSIHPIRDQCFSENYEQLESNWSSQAHFNISTDSSAFDYIQNHGIAAFFDNFLLGGFVNSLNILFQLSIPYLFILLPFGVLFSLRAFDQKSQYIKANWIFIISSILLMSVIISIVPEKRFLFFFNAISCNFLCNSYPARN